MNKQNIALLGLGIVIVLAVIVMQKRDQKPVVRDDPYIKIKNAIVYVEVADTDAKRAQGLSNRNSLAQDSGMLFVFSSPARHSFWMNGMNFPLDFLWIEQNKVADISENVPAPRQTNNKPVVLGPNVPVTYILEVNAGWIKKNGINREDPVEFVNIR